MKLIELLVLELSKRGGWPDGVVKYKAYHDYVVALRQDGGWHPEGILAKVDDVYAIVTKGQYLAALPLFTTIEWNGDGMPPANIDIEYRFRDENCGTDFCIGKVIMYGNEHVFIRNNSNGNEFSQHINTVEFRPVRNDIAKKRIEIVNALNSFTLRNNAIDIYDAIVAKRIPGVHIE